VFLLHRSLQGRLQRMSGGGESFGSKQVPCGNEFAGNPATRSPGAAFVGAAGASTFVD
jgi:hypothetical protein